MSACSGSIAATANLGGARVPFGQADRGGRGRRGRPAQARTRRLPRRTVRACRARVRTRLPGCAGDRVLVPGEKARGARAYLGGLLGRLHAWPGDGLRPGGAWHHLVPQGSPTEEIEAALTLLNATDSRPELSEAVRELAARGHYSSTAGRSGWDARPRRRSSRASLGSPRSPHRSRRNTDSHVEAEGTHRRSSTSSVGRRCRSPCRRSARRNA
jgi:hypothetical protein